MLYSLRWIVILTLVLNPNLLMAEETSREQTIPIMIKVVSDDSTLRTQIIDNISQGLLALGNIDVVEVKGEQQIVDLQILAIKSNTSIGPGFAISAIIMRPPHLPQSLFSEENQDMFSDSLSDLVFLQSHDLFIGSDEELKAVCEKIVTMVEFRHIRIIGMT